MLYQFMFRIGVPRSLIGVFTERNPLSKRYRMSERIHALRDLQFGPEPTYRSVALDAYLAARHVFRWRRRRPVMDRPDPDFTLSGAARDVWVRLIRRRKR